MKVRTRAVFVTRDVVASSSLRFSLCLTSLALALKKPGLEVLSFFPSSLIVSMQSLTVLISLLPLPLVPSASLMHCDERSESRKGLGWGMEIVAVVWEGGCLVRRYAHVRFSLLGMAFSARCFAPRLISPP